MSLDVHYYESLLKRAKEILAEYPEFPTSIRERDDKRAQERYVSQVKRRLSHAKKVQDAKPKNPAAVELGRLGGLKGGPARAAKLSDDQRSEIAHKAAVARWHKDL